MKKLAYLSLVLAFGATLAVGADAPLAVGEITKTGFLVTEKCMQKGEFVDCSLDTISNSPLVLYVHDEDGVYKLDISDVAMSPMYEDVGKNNAKVVGVLTGNTIKVKTFTPAPPETKSFFKGCM